MGLFINCYVNFADMTPESWEAVYQESVALLRAFPAPLMRLKKEEKWNAERFVYTSHIIEGEGIDEEHWKIYGDMTSSRHAEPFQLYRQLEQQIAVSHGQNYDARDVLWADEEALQYVDGHGADLFGNKTQGYPYHLAVLAVALLLESRFPENCYLFGDIDRTQVDHIIHWSNRILEAPVTLPICLDGERLYQRLVSLYPDPTLAIRRFHTLYRGAREEEFASLLRYADRSLLLQEFVNDLSSYASLDQLGAVRLLSKFLSATHDLHTLIELVAQAAAAKPDQQEFSIEKLLDVLGRHFLTIDVQEREPLEFFSRPDNKLMTIEDSFAQIFLTLGGIPSAFSCYIPREEVLETFSACAPEQREVFRDILDKAEESCRTELAQVQDLIHELEKKLASQSSSQEETATRTTDVSPEPHADADYITMQIQTQTQKFPQPETIAEQISVSLQNILNAHPDRFEPCEREALLSKIVQASHQSGFALREFAWQVIDQETDVEILKRLLALALISEREINFWQWRIYLFEHPTLWGQLVETHGSSQK